MISKEKFDKLPNAQKRMEIANDVILQLKLEKIEAGSVYCKLPDKIIDDIYEEAIKTPISLKRLLTKNKKDKCTVCAKGAMFLSHVRNYNDFYVQRTRESDRWDSRRDSISPIDDAETMEVLKYFSENQLEIIENCFETWNPRDEYDDMFLGKKKKEAYSENYNEMILQKATEFGEHYDDKNDRLMAIMQNIVENNGTFKPVLGLKKLKSEAKNSVEEVLQES